jgi:F0F1-type ATP synthase assembly protein I
MYLGDPRDMRRYMTLSQVGLEMVAPIGIGLALDYFLNSMPWATVSCTVLGFVGGMVHLVALSRERPPSGGAS